MKERAVYIYSRTTSINADLLYPGSYFPCRMSQMIFCASSQRIVSAPPYKIAAPPARSDFSMRAWRCSAVDFEDFIYRCHILLHVYLRFWRLRLMSFSQKFDKLRRCDGTVHFWATRRSTTSLIFHATRSALIAPSTRGNGFFGMMRFISIA